LPPSSGKKPIQLGPIKIVPFSPEPNKALPDVQGLMHMAFYISLLTPTDGLCCVWFIYPIYRMYYKTLRGRWCDITVLNVHAPTEDRTDDMKESFYEELERVSDKFPKYHIKFLLGDFNAKVARENIFKPTIGRESLNDISNDNGVRVVNFATSKNFIVKSATFTRRNIH
jgi:hypothetical protein